ncbi:hypothetical protein Lser_V15G28196 [Lactuca serriola]
MIGEKEARRCVVFYSGCLGQSYGTLGTFVPLSLQITIIEEASPKTSREWPRSMTTNTLPSSFIVEPEKETRSNQPQ